MAHLDHGLVNSMGTLSRRNVLQAGVLAALASGDLAKAKARIARINKQEQNWESSVETKLDPRAAIFDEAGVAITLTDLFELEEGFLYAFDVETGERLWERPIADPPTVRFQEDYIYHHDEETLTALDPRLGTEQWSTSGEFGQPSAYEGEYAAFTSEFGGPTVINLVDGTIPWELDTRTMTDPIALVGGTLVLHGDQEFAAYDIKTGEQLWQYEKIPPGGLNLTVRVSWPYCFVTSAEPAETLALNLTNGTASWRIDRSAYPKLFVSDGPAEGVVLGKDIGTVTALDPGTGEERWSQSLTEKNLFLYLVADGLAIPVAEDHIWAISLDEGTVEWDHSLDTPFPMVRESNDSFYVADTGIQAFSHDGSLTWNPDFTGEESLFPDVSDSHLVLTSGTSVYGFGIKSPPGETSTTTTTSETTATTEQEYTTTEAPASPTRETESTETTSPAGGTSTDATTPGFGAVSAVIGLTAVIAEYLRRNSDSEEE